MSASLIKGLFAAALLALTITPAQALEELLIGGGARTGVYYQAARALCAAVNRNAGTRLHCLGRPSLGSVFNIKAVERGLLDFGIAQSDRVWEATHGRAEWSRVGPVADLRSVFAVHPETVLLVVRKAAGIRSVDDLRNHRVNIGNPGSGQRGNAEDVLRIHGIDPRRDIRAESLQQGDASRALADGKIDAFFYTVGNPSAAITGPAGAVDIDLIPLDSPGIRAFVEASPYYVMSTIAAGTYRGVERPVRTFAVKATLITAATTGEDVVYDLVKAVFEHLDAFKASHPAFGDLRPDTMLEGLSAPLHLGAERYFRDIGLRVPGELIRVNLRIKAFLPLLVLGSLTQAYLVFLWLPDNVRGEREQHVAKIDAHVQSLASTLLVPVLDTDLAAIYGTLDGVMSENPYWKQLVLKNERGAVLYPLDPVDHAGLGYHVLRRSIVYLDDPVGELVLSVDIEAQVAEQLARLHRLLWIVLGVIAAFVITTGLVIELFVRRPVNRLSEATERLSAGDFAVPLPRAGRDEVGRLVNSFQFMRESIHRFREDLEGQVRERNRAEKVQLGRSRVLEKLAAGEPLEEILTVLVETIEQVESGMLCSVLLLDESGKHLRRGAAPSLPGFYNQAVDGLEIGPGIGSCGAAAFEQHRVIVEDIQDHPNWAAYLHITRRAGLRACWSEPIQSSDGRILGTFAMYYGEPRSPSAEELKSIETAAALAGIAIERTRIEQALRTSENRFRALFDENPSMFFTLDAEANVVSANDFAAEQLGCSVDELVGMSWLELHHPDDRAATAAQLRDCLHDPGRVGRWEARKIRRDGATLWVHENARVIGVDDGSVAILVVCEDTTEARRLSDQLTYQATHDGLTGLVNRGEFEVRLARVLETAREEHTENALCYLDLDQFKVINDTCGHIAGDELLRQLGVVLQDRVRDRDTLARLGGDEFGVLMERCPLGQARRVAEQLRLAIEEFHFVWDDKLFDVGVSIGMVPVTASSGGTTAVLSAADNACYAAKEQGRNRIHVYRENDLELAGRLREMQWPSRIARALEENRFELWSQPILPLDCGDGDTATAGHHELLLRMQGEDGHLIPPGAFLPAAERYHLSPKIDRWVLATALDRLTRDPGQLRRLRMCAINLSGLTLGDETFLEFVIEQFEKTGVPAHRICFEITETAAITNLASASRFIKALKELGCRFALDDFGSGISSFAYLKNLPVDFLKIDGMFVKDIVDDPIDFAMVKSINDIGRVMGKQTIAEFVENDAILDKLREIGVDYAQGYGIGHPQPLETPAPESGEILSLTGSS